MSIPRRDPNFTYEQLREAAAEFGDAGQRYWEATHKAGMNVGAIVWCQDTDGRLAIFTRGEYREQLMRNIERLAPVFLFGASSLEEEEEDKEHG